VLRIVVIKVVPDRNRALSTSQPVVIDSSDTLVDFASRACYCFEHSVGAERVEIGTCECKRQSLGDARQRHGRIESEPVDCGQCKKLNQPPPE